MQTTLPKKILTFPIRLALIIMIYGALFKVMHWPYANQLIRIGSLAILLLYTIRFVYKKEKITLDYVKLALVLIWVFSYAVKVFHFVNIPYVFEVLLVALVVWWFVEEGFTYFSKRKLKDNGFIKFFYYGFCISSIALMILGCLFKILHWPYGALLLTLGVLVLSIMLIVDYFVIKRT